VLRLREGDELEPRSGDPDDSAIWDDSYRRWVSRDYRWWWDNDQWIAAATVPPSPLPGTPVRGNRGRTWTLPLALLAVGCAVSLVIGITIGGLAGNHQGVASRQVLPEQYAQVRAANIGFLEQALARVPLDCSTNDRGRCSLSIAYALALTQKSRDELLPAPTCLRRSDAKLRLALSELDSDLHSAAADIALARTEMPGVADLAASDALFNSEACAHSTSSQPESSAVSTSSPSPVRQFITFDSGTKVVGTDIQPGTYRTRRAQPGCYLARLRGFSGALDDIISNELSNAPVVVTILATDKGFRSENCDTWTSDLSQITSSKSSFSDGDFIVGTDMTPGTYRNAAAQGCYWARLKGFGHTLDDILANDNTDVQTVVTIAASDGGFESANCGTWTKIG